MTDPNMIVRLTYRELAEMTHKAKQADDTASKAKEKEEKVHRAKKPEQPIYQVHVRRQQKGIEKEETKSSKNNKQGVQMTGSSNMTNQGCTDTSNHKDSDTEQGSKDLKKKSRRPDMQIYIPKPKQQFAKSESTSADENVNSRSRHNSVKNVSNADENVATIVRSEDDYEEDDCHDMNDVHASPVNHHHHHHHHHPPLYSPKSKHTTFSSGDNSPGGSRSVDLHTQFMEMKVTVANDVNNMPSSPGRRKAQHSVTLAADHIVPHENRLDRASNNKPHRDRNKSHGHGQGSRFPHQISCDASESREDTALLETDRSADTVAQDRSRSKTSSQHRLRTSGHADNLSSSKTSRTSHNHAEDATDQQVQDKDKSPKKKRRRRRRGKMSADDLRQSHDHDDEYKEVFQGLVIENSKLKDSESRFSRKRGDTMSSECAGSDDEVKPEVTGPRSMQRDHKNVHLKVTLAQDERHVKVINKGSASKHTNNTASKESNQGKRGGLLYLPANQTRSSVDDTAGRTGGHGQHHTSRRAVSGRVLYDPNKPHSSRSEESSAQNLHFYDESDHMHMPALPYHDDFVRKAVEDYEFATDAYYHNYSVSHHDAGEYYADDPYHQNSEGEAYAAGAKTNHSAEKLLQEATPLHGQLNRLLSRRFHGESMWQKIVALREQVQRLYEQVILLDPDLAKKQNTEQLMWKVCYYQVIEMLRRQESDVSENETNNYMQQLLAQGTTFYEELLNKLQDTFNFNLDNYLDAKQVLVIAPSRTIKLALLSAQRIMICLGDLARYKEQVSHSTNYGKARSWYMKAQILAPKNGRPYNQLAILALYTRRNFDAVYNYMRSLAASNPFLTARESLMSLFDEARKKADHNQKKHKQTEDAVHKTETKQKPHNGERVEIWIGPDLTGQKPEREATDLDSLSAVELNKKFVLSYLVIQGKLFTKTGMESFHDTCATMFRELQSLFHHTPFPISNTRLLQLMAMNMFAIENAKSRVVEDDFNGRCCPVLQEDALQMSLVMFALILQRCVESLREHVKSHNYQVLSENLRQLFPSIKIWCDWMSCHTVQWNPPAVFKKPEKWPDVEIWELFADFCNVLKEVDTSVVKLYDRQKEGCLPVILSEDTMMTGFVPLLSMPQQIFYVHCTVDMEVARDCSRIQQIRVFGEYLCGIEPPVLKYDVERRQFVSIAETQYTDESCSSEYEDTESEEDVLIESEENAASDDEQHIHPLRRRKQELHQRVEQQQMHRDRVQALIENENKKVKMELEIRPLYLVPDTNCFIDHLDGIQQLLQTQKFTVVVPLIVITELDGLAKGSRESHHAPPRTRMVSEHASVAVDFLEQQFASRNNLLRAITSRGTVMETIMFRSEDIQEMGNNDDTILSCCLHYCKDNPRDYMPKQKDAPVHILREVVLLTDDRNLRLKAHTCNVPVKDIPAFLTFAGLAKENE